MPDSCTCLQASVAKGSIRLADNGARLAGRLAQLDDDIARQSELVRMYAEQLGHPNIAPAMQADLHGPPVRNNASWQKAVEQQQQQHPVASSRHTHNARQQQKLMHGVANAHLSQQTAQPTDAGHGAHASPASRLPPGISADHSRTAAVGQLARSSAGNRHQRSSHSSAGLQGAEKRGRPIGAGDKHRQAGQAPNAGKGRQGHAIDSRYCTTDENPLLKKMVVLPNGKRCGMAQR